MELRYLLQRHQKALTASTDAASKEARASHRGLAAGYAGRIALLHANADAAIAPNERAVQSAPPHRQLNRH